LCVLHSGVAFVVVLVFLSMAENKKSFILYCDQKGIWDKLSDEQAGKLIKHVLSYVNDENPTTNDFIIELAFESLAVGVGSIPK